MEGCDGVITSLKLYSKFPLFDGIIDSNTSKRDLKSNQR